MIKNRIAQIVFQTAFCTMGILGIIASLGFLITHFVQIFLYISQI